MKPTIHFSLLLIVLQVQHGHGDADPLQEQLASSFADFAFKFSRQVASLQGGKNIFFSPMTGNIPLTQRRLIRKFFIGGGKTEKVDMMVKSRHYRYFHDEDLTCWVVELPYKGGAFAWFILPDEGQLKKVEDALGEKNLSKWRTSLNEGNEVDLSLPKFSMSASYDLKKVLSGLGITDVFSDNADLSGISESSNLKINKATHEAVMDIYEIGTEAAAVSAVEMIPHSLSLSKSISLTFNRPFFFFILAPNDGPMLFMGKVVNPAQI